MHPVTAALVMLHRPVHGKMGALGYLNYLSSLFSLQHRHPRLHEVVFDFFSTGSSPCKGREAGKAPARLETGRLQCQTHLRERQERDLSGQGQASEAAGRLDPLLP